MASSNPSSEQNTINFKLAEMIKNLSEKQQLVLLKQLLKGNLLPTMYRLIGKMTEDQQSALLKKLQENPLQSVSLEESEIALRGHNRKSCMLGADYKVDGHSYEGFMLDISPAGTFIETGEPFTAGQQIEVSFSLPNAPKQLKAIGGILWKGMLGIGVKFDDIADDQADLIKAFMEVEEQ
jgi:Tfp pilus assembly protein PilZ